MNPPSFLLPFPALNVDVMVGALAAILDQKVTTEDGRHRMKLVENKDSSLG